MIIQNGRAQQAVVAARGNYRAVIIGHHSVTGGNLERTLASTDVADAWESFVRTTSGSYILLHGDSQNLVVRGSGYGSSRIYYSVHDGATIVSDRAFVLALATKASIDPSGLSSYLVENAPFRLAERPLWSGVVPVPPGHAITISRAGATPVSTRWREYGVADHMEDSTTASDVIRRETVAAVKSRVSDKTAVSSELSGGFDSTAITAIAMRYCEQVSAFTIAGRDPANEDLNWARIAARAMPNIEHNVIHKDEHARFFDGLGDEDLVPLDEPSIASAGPSRLMNVYRRVGARGLSTHLTGHGGDQLFTTLPVALHDSVRQRPLRGSRNVFAAASFGAWSVEDAAQVFIDQRSFRSWWKLESQRMRADDNTGPRPLFGWGVPLRVPPWVTDSAVTTIGQGLETHVVEAGPLAPTRAQNQRLELIFNGIRLARAISQMTDSIELDLSSPFYDDAVIDSVISISQVSSYSTTDYKPVMARSMRGIIPDEVLTRTTKDDGSIDVAQGLNDNAEVVRSLFSESRLGQMGLIDAGMLHKILANPADPLLDDGAVFATLACELWIRTYDEWSIAA